MASILDELFEYLSIDERPETGWKFGEHLDCTTFHTIDPNWKKWNLKNTGRDKPPLFCPCVGLAAAGAASQVNRIYHPLLDEGPNIVGAHVRIIKRAEVGDPIEETRFAIVLTCSSCNRSKVPVHHQAEAVQIVDGRSFTFYGYIQVNLRTCKTNDWGEVFEDRDPQTGKRLEPPRFRFSQNHQETFGSATWQRITSINVEEKQDKVTVNGIAKFGTKGEHDAQCEYANDGQNFFTQLLLYMMNKLNANDARKGGFQAKGNPTVLTINKGKKPEGENGSRYMADPHLRSGAQPNQILR